MIDASDTEQPEPHWERGYQVWGYWIGIVRWGYIGLPMKRFGGAAKHGYTWGFSPRGIIPHPVPIEGTMKTLREAKRAVETKYKEWSRMNPSGSVAGKDNN